MAIKPVHVSYRVLVSLLLAAIPLAAVSAYFALGIGRAQLRDAFADQLGDVAERTAASVDSYVFRAMLDVSLLAKVPLVREAARDALERPYDVEWMMQVDELWQSGVIPPPAIASFFESQASVFFRELSNNDPIYREIILTDRHGRLVAASGATSDYVQSDEAWWTDAYGDGVTGAVHVSDVAWDESAGAFALGIAVPVLSPAGDSVAGVLLVLLDSREMFAAIRGTGSLEAELIRTDGSVVFGQTRTGAPIERFFGEALLRERLATVESATEPYRLSFTASGPEGGQRLVAVAPCQIGTSYASLPWLVAVSRSEAQLFAPVAAQWRNLIYALATTGLVVLGLALWFSFRLAVPREVGETEMHLVDHAKTPHLDDDET